MFSDSGRAVSALVDSTLSEVISFRARAADLATSFLLSVFLSFPGVLPAWVPHLPFRVILTAGNMLCVSQPSFQGHILFLVGAIAVAFESEVWVSAFLKGSTLEVSIVLAVFW